MIGSEKNQNWADKMVQYVKVPIAMPDKLTPIWKRERNNSHSCFII